MIDDFSRHDEVVAVFGISSYDIIWRFPIHGGTPNIVHFDSDFS